jgi:hypothetical protein
MRPGFAVDGRVGGHVADAEFGGEQARDRFSAVQRVRELRLLAPAGGGTVT